MPCLHFSQLHSDRDPIPEVPAVYFCSPTEENLGRICQDLDNCTYDQFHLNFISPITRQKLEDLAASAIQTNSAVNINKVFDQYLNFICLEDDLFIMKHQQSDSLSYYGKYLSKSRLRLLFIVLMRCETYELYNNEKRSNFN